MNPDFAIILNFDLQQTNKFDADLLVKTARNIGVRAVSGSEALAAACQKYTIALIADPEGVHLNSFASVIDELVANRFEGKTTIIDIPVNEDGTFSEASQELFAELNDWMHMFGHALNEGEISNLVSDHGHILKNRHANYQEYVFLKTPLPETITVTGLKQAPARVDWIENRVEQAFTFEDGKLMITLIAPDRQFSWNVLRIQAHRPEDDLGETKF